MTAKILDITTYSPKSTDLFFFDNNVWMYLFCPLGSYNKSKQKHYSSFLQGVIASHGTIFINSMVLSEFTNRYLRMDFELWKVGKAFTIQYKKDYVGTQRYKDTVAEIKSNINKIMKFCLKSSDNFNAINLGAVLNHLSQIDFNDSYYIELSALGNWKLVTDDRDFTKYPGHSVEIVTIV
jgi:predicted nucleic acid-binding protein